MISISIDRSGLRKLERELARIRAQIPQAAARGLNEGGDKVRTQVRRAMREQTGLIRLQSVTKRQRTVRAYSASLSYAIVFAAKPPTKPAEFRTRVTMGRGGGVVIWLWGVAHKFKRSFKQKDKGGLRMRLDAARLPIRGFDGPNLAKEAVKGETKKVFFDTTASAVVPIVEKHIARALK